MDGTPPSGLADAPSLPPNRSVERRRPFALVHIDVIGHSLFERLPEVTKLTDAGWEPQYDLRETLEEAMSYYVDTYERERAASLD